MHSPFAVLMSLARERCWPLLAVSLAAWMILAYESFAGVSPPFCTSNVDVPLMASTLAGLIEATVSPAGIGSALVMLTAMMVPLLPAQMMRLWDGSLVGRRGRAVAVFLAGYLAVAIPAILGLALLTAIGAMMMPAWALMAVVWATAVMWQFTPIKRKALSRCHRRPVLPLFGLRADTTRFRFGIETAAACMTSCWALMMIPHAAGALYLPAMLGVFLSLVSERFGRLQPLGMQGWAILRQRISKTSDRRVRGAIGETALS